MSEGVELPPHNWPSGLPVNVFMYRLEQSVPGLRIEAQVDRPAWMFVLQLPGSQVRQLVHQTQVRLAGEAPLLAALIRVLQVGLATKTDPPAEHEATWRQILQALEKEAAVQLPGGLADPATYAIPVAEPEPDDEPLLIWGSK